MKNVQESFARSVAGYQRAIGPLLADAVQPRPQDYLPLTYMARYPFSWRFIFAVAMQNRRKQVSIVDGTVSPEKSLIVYASPSDHPLAAYVMSSGNDHVPVAEFLRAVTLSNLSGEKLVGSGAPQGLEDKARLYFPDHPIEEAERLTLRGYMASKLLHCLSVSRYYGPAYTETSVNLRHYEKLWNDGYTPLNIEQLYGLGSRAVDTLIQQYHV